MKNEFEKWDGERNNERITEISRNLTSQKEIYEK